MREAVDLKLNVCQNKNLPSSNFEVNLIRYCKVGRLMKTRFDLVTCVTLTSCVSASGCQGCLPAWLPVSSQGLPGDQTGLFWASSETVLFLPGEYSPPPRVFSNFLLKQEKGKGHHFDSTAWGDCIISGKMPGHRSPDGTVMVRGGQPTHGEDDSTIAKVSKIHFWYFFLNVTSGYLLMKPSTYLLSDYNCLRLLLCGHHLPNQRLVLLQGFTEIKFDPILLCRCFFYFFYWPIV